MTNKQLIRLGLIANAALVVVGAIAVYLLADPGPSDPPAAARTPERAALTEEAPPPRLVPPEGVQGPNAEPLSSGAPPARLWVRAPPSAYSASATAGAPSGAQAQIALARRREALRAARRDLSEGFSALRQRVDGCGAKEASFVLSLEAADGAVRVESARLEFRGAAPEGAIACAQAALSGQIIPAPAIVPGRRWEVSL